MSQLVPSLLRWFESNARELPWRSTRDPYAIWLSEVILQQTRIQQGWSYWERFMERWPTVDDLAAATEDEVLRLWQGLGYYSRARNLHYAARQIVALGHFPDTYADIRRLKGVGDYTAAAIGSFAFGLPLAVVDGNVYRVLARYFGIDTPINTIAGKHLFAELAQELMDEAVARERSEERGERREERGERIEESRNDIPGLYNQALMDFGAVLCTPQSPHCIDCPLSSSCEALSSGRVGELPVKLKTLKIKERHLVYIYIRCNGETAIHRRGSGDIWQGLWEPYCEELGSKELGSKELGMMRLCRIPSSSCRPLAANVRHVLTHRVLFADFCLLETAERPQLPDDYIWIPEADIDNYALPRLVERLLDYLPPDKPR